MAEKEEIWKEQALRLKSFMNHYNWMSARQLALKIDMEPSQLSRIIRGDNGLPRNRAEQIGALNGVSPEWLLHGKEPIPEWFVSQKTVSGGNKNVHDVDFPFHAARFVLKEVRKALDISHETFGKRIQRSKDLMLRMERGDRSVTMLSWVLLMNYLRNMTNEDWEKVKHIFEEREWEKAGFEDDEDDEDYRRIGRGDESQIELLKSIIAEKNQTIEQKDSIIKQLQSLTSKQ